MNNIIEVIKAIGRDIKALTSKQAEYLKETKEKFDIIFIDPPYKADISVDALRMIKENELLKRDGFVVIETDEYLRDKSELEKITDIEVFDHRKYGRANLIFIK